MNNVTKDQHYVAQGYLRGFSISHSQTDKFVWVYDKEFANGSAPKQPKSVKSICSEVFYYSQSDDGDDILEKKGFKRVEDEVIPIIKNLGFSGGKVILTEEERAKLSFFIALAHTRAPSYRNSIKELEKRKLEIIIDQNPMKIKGPNGEDFHEYIESIGGLKLEIFDQCSLEPMVSDALALSMSMLKKTWQFFVPPKGLSFATGDNPTIFNWPKQVFGDNPYANPVHPNMEILFPVRKDIALVCTSFDWNHMGVTEWSSEKVKNFNKDVAKAARKYVVADFHSSAFAKIVLENKDREQKLDFD